MLISSQLDKQGQSLNSQVSFRVLPQPNVQGFNNIWSSQGAGSVINQAPVVPDRHNMRAPRSNVAKSLFGTMNEGHAKVELSSFSGTIKILKRD